MTDRTRMTVQVLSHPDGSHEVFLSLNPAARVRLIEELTKLDRSDDHFHVFDYDVAGDGFYLSAIPYKPGDQLAGHFKVLLRQEDWDEQYYPHVMAPPSEP